MSTQVPEGWYADPQDRSPGAERWWNGHQWTAHTRRQAVAPPPTAPPPPAGGPAWTAGSPAAAEAQQAGVPTVLDDGTPLAPLGARIGAHAIDVALVWFVVSVVLTVAGGVRLLVSAVVGLEPLGGFGAPLRAIVLAGAWLGYQVVVLTRGMPSVGKRVVGLRVRHLDPASATGPGLDASTALTRALAGAGGVLFVLFPGSQLFGTALLALDAYRMQQDRWRRPWHDQLAGTAVVRPPDPGP